MPVAGLVRIKLLSHFLSNFTKEEAGVANTTGWPSQVNGAGLRLLSRRGSWVQIPPPALLYLSK